MDLNKANLTRRTLFKFAPVAVGAAAGLGALTHAPATAFAAGSFSSPIEVGARRPSENGQRFNHPSRDPRHMGTDYPPPTPGQAGGPITAIAAGTVLRTGRGNTSTGSPTLDYHSGLGVVLDHGIVGGDRLYSYYGHLQSIEAEPGQSVEPGTRIGAMGGSGASGANDFAVHLHMGIFINDDRPLGPVGSGSSGFIDPEAWFAAKNIVPGQTPPGPGGNDDGGGNDGGSDQWPQADLPSTDAHTDASHRAWVTLLGDIGHTNSSLTVNVQNWLTERGFYNGAVDGEFGPVTVKALQQFLADRGFYKGVVDGDRGPMTVRAEIAFLNDQRRFY